MSISARVGAYQDQPGQIFAQGLYEQSSTQKHRLGTIRMTDDGRMFAYAYAGAAALAPGKLTSGVAPEANWTNVAVAEAASLGAKRVKVTLGATDLAANLLKDGWLHINDSYGAGHLYKIRGNPAITGSASGYIELYDEIRDTALTTASKATLTQNVQYGVIINATTLVSTLAGVPPIDVTANYYFWNQVKGLAAVLTHGTIVIGDIVGPSSQSTPVAGSVEALATTDVIGACGVCVHVNADTKYSLINLNIGGY